MKKIAVLAIGLVMLATAAFASDITATGEFTYGGIANADGNAQKYGNSYVYATWKIDDINSLNAEWYAGDLSGDNPWSMDIFQLVTDLGKAMGLDKYGMSLQMQAGRFYANNKDYAAVSGYENEDVIDGVGVVANGGFLFDLGVKSLVHLVYAQDWDVSATGDYKFGAYTVTGPLSLAAWFSGEGFAPADGTIGVEAKVALGSMLGENVKLNVGASFMDNLAADTYAWGAGIGAGFGMFTASVGVNGDNTDFLNGVGIAVGVAPLANISIDAGVFLDTFDGAPESMNALDISAAYKAGASTLRVGYLVSSLTVAGDIVALNAPVGLADGGIYVKWDVDF